MRHEQFQSERQKLEAERKAIQDQVRKATEAENRYHTAYGQYKPWDELMTSNPALRQEIEQVVDRYKNSGGQPQNQDALLESLLERPELKAYQEGYQEWQKDKETREKEKRVSDAVNQLKTEIPDYDDAPVTQFLEDLAKVPSQDSERALRQLIHYSILGRERAGKLEQRTDPRPGVPNVASTPGKQTTGPRGERTPEQEYEDAIRRVANVK